MLRWTLTLIGILLFSACSDGTDIAKPAVEATLAYRKDVKYQNLETFPGGVVCGEFNAEDPKGGPVGYKQFIARENWADTRPSDDDWQIFCSKDPATALQSALGIGPINTQNTNLLKIHEDLTELDLALNQYLSDNHFFPPGNQGLAGLVSAGTKGQKPRKFREGGYIKEVPNDPWGRPYFYEISALGGIAPTYRLYTLGADGVEGGRGENADIGNKHLKYLNHIVNL